jgi:hypothetical protein
MKYTSSSLYSTFEVSLVRSKGVFIKRERLFLEYQEVLEKKSRKVAGRNLILEIRSIMK